MAGATQAKDPPAAGDHEGDQGANGKSPPRPEKSAKTSFWPWIAGAVVVLGFVLVVLWIILAPHPRQKTDDAYVTAHYATIAPRVGGQVVRIAVDDNQPVRAGQLLLQLDDRDFRAALSQAEANLAGDRARAAEAAAQLARQPALIREAQTRVVSAQAKLDLSRVDTMRYFDLAVTGAGTVQQHQQADVTRRQDEAALVGAQAETTAQTRELDALRATESAADARVAADQAQVAQARLNLSYTTLIAPIDGVVDQRQVQVGNFLTPGAPVMVVAPLQAVYVMANYRELALRHMRPGQSVRIHLDAYDVDLDGVVDSLPAASGAAYSPIPPTNATGNFTKIVQRLPVKIVFRPGQRLTALARVGMSVETTVDTGLEDVVAETRHGGRRAAARR